MPSTMKADARRRSSWEPTRPLRRPGFEESEAPPWRCRLTQPDAPGSCSTIEHGTKAAAGRSELNRPAMIRSCTTCPSWRPPRRRRHINPQNLTVSEHIRKLTGYHEVSCGSVVRTATIFPDSGRILRGFAVSSRCTLILGSLVHHATATGSRVLWARPRLRWLVVVAWVRRWHE